MGRRVLTVGALLAAVLAVVAALVLVLGDPVSDGGRPVPAPDVPGDPEPGVRGPGGERTRVRRATHPASRAYCEVLLEDGAPAAGATVVVVRPEGRAEHLVTGVDGRVAWQPPRKGSTVFAVREGAACSRDVSVDGEERIVLRLGPGATVAGTVRWQDDTPAADVIVDMSIWRTGYTTQWVTRTDSAGRFSFRGVPPGARVQLLVRHVKDCVPMGDAPLRDAGDWRATSEVDLLARRPARAVVHVDLVLPAGAEPPTGYRVEASDADGVVLTAARIGYRAEERRLFGTVRADVATILRITAGTLQGEVGPFTAGDGEELHLTAHLRAEPRVILRATTPDGRPATTDDLVAHLLLERDGTVEPLGGNPFRGSATLDVTRRLPTLTALHVSGARFHVILDGPGIARSALSSDRGANLTLDGYDLARRLEAGSHIELTVPLHRPIRATIETRDPDGAIVPGVAVHLEPPIAFAPTHVRTGADGRAEVDVLVDPAEAERLTLLATAADTHRGSMRLAPPTALDATPEWTVVVESLRTYGVRVVDESGAVVRGGRVETGYWKRWAVDEEGGATIDVLPGEGVSFVGDGLDSAEVTAPESGDEIVLVATPLAEVVVDVVSTGIDPPPDTVRVRVIAQRGMSASTHSLSGDPARLHIPLRGMRGVNSVRVLVTTVDGRYHGSVDTAPGADPVTLTLQFRK